MSKPAGDEHMGKWVYCKQHLNVHSTGWCTVYPTEKIALKAETEAEAFEEVRANGWKIWKWQK
jgi:hypothetical protein